MLRPTVGIAVDGVTTYGRAILRGAMQFANERRQWLIHEDFGRAGELLPDWPRCDGAIVGSGRVEFDTIRAATKHVVYCSGSGDPDQSPVVSLDDRAVGRVAAEHFLNCRLTNFAYVGPTSPGVSTERQRGMADALARRGYDCHVPDVQQPGSLNFNYSHWPLLGQWLAALPKPVGVLAMDDSGAHAVAGACVKAGIAVPERVAVLGVNNDDLLCESAWPPLSSVEGDFRRVGYAAAQLLDRLLKGETLAPAERVVRLPPLGVVQRQSTDVLAIDDPNLADALRYIREHACDPCSVVDVLARVPVGRRWLERQFGQRIGRSPNDEILRVRMDAARRMLLQQNLGLADVAERCGFSTLSAFGRAFTREHGTSPGAFRRRAKKPRTTDAA